MLTNCPLSHPAVEKMVGVALSARDKILEIYSCDFDVFMKAGEEPVTIADRMADDIIVAGIKRFFPEDRILSEENGLFEPSGAGNRAWFIDPVDGTREFIKKNGEFAIQIGLSVAGELDFGLVLQPVNDNLYLAAKNQGCFHYAPGKGWNQLKIKATDYKGNLTLALSRSNPSGLAADIHQKMNGKKIVNHGGVGLKLMSIARNFSHYYVNDSNATKAWDLAGPEILFTEAGGIVSDLKGNRFKYFTEDYRHQNGMLASCCEHLQQKILDLIKK